MFNKILSTLVAVCSVIYAVSVLNGAEVPMWTIVVDQFMIAGFALAWGFGGKA